MKIGPLALLLILCNSTRGAAQITHSRVDISAGPTWFGSGEESPGRSWFLEGAVNISNWFALAGLADWSRADPINSFANRYTRSIFSGGTVIAQTYDVETVETQRAVMGGVRFVGQDSNHLAAFAQTLVGYGRRRTAVTVTPLTDDFARAVVEQDSGAGAGLVWQAGGGVEVFFTRHLGAIASLDYRRARTIITGGMRDVAEFTGVEGFDRTANEINFSLGITARLGRR